MSKKGRHGRPFLFFMGYFVVGNYFHRGYIFYVLPAHAAGAHPLSGATKDAKRSSDARSKDYFYRWAINGFPDRTLQGSGLRRRIVHT